jgi:hypothetical protein
VPRELPDFVSKYLYKYPCQETEAAMGGQLPENVDEETAESMRNLAEIFIANAATEGWHFSWDVVDVIKLDELCDAFIASDPSPERQRVVGLGLAAYLGELLLRGNGAGRWAYDAERCMPYVDLPHLEMQAYPQSKVFKRLDKVMGSEHSLVLFLMYGLSREVPPGAKISKSPSRH